MARRKRWLWLVLAAVLFAGAALLMGLYDKPPVAPPQVNLPRFMDRQARERLERRRTLPRFNPAVAAGEIAPERPKRPLDPLLAALPATVKKAAIIVEANALRNSPVGQLFVDCFMQREGDDFERFTQKSGVNPLKDLDRVAYVDDTMILSGNFAEARMGELFNGATPNVIDERTTLYERPGREHLAVWNKQMVIFGRSREEVTGVLDRLEGRTIVETPVIPEHETYGEIYGLVTGAMVADALGRDQAELAERFRGVASKIMLHVDASRDVGIVADVTGKEAGETQDFAKALGAGLTLARLEAMRQGHNDIAQALDVARVDPAKSGAKFRAELGLPLELFKTRLTDCARRTRTRRDGSAAPPSN